MKEYLKYFRQGQEYQRINNPHKALDSFKKSLHRNKHFAEAWYQAAVSLLLLKRNAEAGMYLRTALTEFQLQAERRNQQDQSLYRMACCFALLGEDDSALEQLQKSLKISPILAEIAKSEWAFARLSPRTLELFLQPALRKVKDLRFRGDYLNYTQLSPTQVQYRESFLKLLTAAGWQAEDYQEALQSEKGACPQAFAEYRKNPDLILELHYHLDTFLLFMRLKNRYEAADFQDYRLYQYLHPLPVIETLIRHQDQVNSETWEALIADLIDDCGEVLLEMPDGRKVKVS